MRWPQAHKKITRYGYLRIIDVCLYTSVRHYGFHLTPVVRRVLTRHFRSADRQLQEGH